MTFSYDVNIVFASADPNHLFFRPVNSHLSQKLRYKIVTLANVKSSFIHTYAKYLKDVALLIDKSIRDYRKEREEAPSKRKPSFLIININVMGNIRNQIEENSKKIKNYNPKAVDEFVKEMISKYTIPELFNNDDAFADFREEYLEKSETVALDILNKFILKFKSGNQAMYYESYKSYADILQSIKDSELDIFESKKDHEDMNIGAEYLAYNKDFSKIDFITCDRDCGESIKTFAKEESLTAGRITIIRPLKK